MATPLNTKIRIYQVGALFEEVDDETRAARGLPAHFPCVHYAIEGTIADEAGIKGGDVILEVDGISLIDREYVELVGLNAGKRVIFTIVRCGEKLEIPIDIPR